MVDLRQFLKYCFFALFLKLFVCDIFTPFPTMFKVFNCSFEVLKRAKADAGFFGMTLKPPKPKNVDANQMEMKFQTSTLSGTLGLTL